MYNPYDYNNKNNDSQNGNTAPNAQDNGNSYQWQAPQEQQQAQPNQTYWQGDTYHSYRDPGYSNPQQGYSEPSYSQNNSSPWVPAQNQGSPKPPEKKPMSKAKKTVVKALAGVMACFMISAGSIGGFAAMVNNGYITLSNSSSAPAFTITKVTGNTTPTSTVSGQLTDQEIAKKVIPSVVCIQNYQVQNGGNGNAIANFYGSGDNGADISPAGEGSGIIATSDGYIITNAHVVSGATSLKVILSTGETKEATLVGSDSVTDLALLKIDATGLPAAEFGDSDSLEVADSVMAVGNPGGMEFNSSVTLGYISALDRDVTGSDGYTMKCIQTDAAINPGNSGGALVNQYGQVIGINSSKIVADGYEGLGFAIPINTAQPVISDLKEHGYVVDRAVLGISGQFVDSMTSRFYGLPQGMFVAEINSDAITSAGIAQGDVITSIDDKQITASTSITAVVANKKPGETVTLKVTRPSTGVEFTATVKLSASTGK